MSILPLVSICIPSYNAEHFIGDAIRSALNQTYENIEIIICDDVSTDSSWNVINEFNDDRISKFKNGCNLGLVGNFREVLRKSNGKYISYLCNDDILLPDAISILVNLLESDSEFNFAFGNVEFLGQRVGGTNYTYPASFSPGVWIKESFRMGKNLTYLIGTLFRKIDEDPCNTIVDLVFFDWYLWARLGTGKVAFSRKKLGMHRYHANNQTNQLTPGFLQNYFGLKKVLTLLFHNRIINKVEFSNALNNLTVNYSTFFYQEKSYPYDSLFSRVKNGCRFCNQESLNSFKVNTIFILKGFYLFILSIFTFEKRT